MKKDQIGNYLKIVVIELKTMAKTKFQKLHLK